MQFNKYLGLLYDRFTTMSVLLPVLPVPAVPWILYNSMTELLLPYMTELLPLFKNEITLSSYCTYDYENASSMVSFFLFSRYMYIYSNNTLFNDKISKRIAILQTGYYSI